MKKMKKILAIIVLLAFVLSACTMEKRIYMPGFNITSKKGIHKIEKQELVKNDLKKDVISVNKKTDNIIELKKLTETIAVNNAENENNTLDIANTTARKDNDNIGKTSIIDIPNLKKAKENDESLSSDSCDNIVLKNGGEISAKVIEIGTTEIKYKKCDNLNGPINVINKSEVLMIKYSNGSKDIITSSSSSNSITPTLPTDDSTKQAFRILGWVIWGIGFIILLLVSILLGLLICGIGILFMILGMKKRK